jgi:hypothetical protein
MTGAGMPKAIFRRTYRLRPAQRIAMFYAWAVLSNITGDDSGLEDMAEIKKLLSERKLTPGSVFLQFRDGKLFDDDFNLEERPFAGTYYQNADCYIADYDSVLGAEHTTLYRVPDSWGTFDKLRSILDTRLDEWRRGVLRPKSAQ